MENEIALIEPPAAAAAMAVYVAPEGAGLEPYFAHIRKQIDEFEMPSDLSLKAERDRIRSFAVKITRSKTALEAVGKALAAEAKAIPNKIDASRRLVESKLKGWHDEFRAPLTAWEENDEARVQSHLDEIKWMRAEPPASFEVQDLRDELARIESVQIGPKCEEFLAEYAIAKDEGITFYKALIAKREKQEADQAELAALRKAAAERDEADRQAAIRQAAKEAAEREAAAAVEREKERARIAAEYFEQTAQREREAIEAAAQAEREAAEAREAALIRQHEEERRLADERRAAEAREIERAKILAREEEERRASNKRHRAAVDQKARNALIDVLASSKVVITGDESSIAEEIIEAIAEGRIPGISINY